jgi:hypothetical protein
MAEQEQPEEQQQLTFPATNFNIQPNGLVITTMLAPDLHIVKFVDESAMNALCGKWTESRKQLKQELQLIQDIKNNKVRDIRQLLVKP